MCCAWDDWLTMGNVLTRARQASVACCSNFKSLAHQVAKFQLKGHFPLQCAESAGGKESVTK